jgi:apolipoprotein N-acyltransferase
MPTPVLVPEEKPQPLTIHSLPALRSPLVVLLLAGVATSALLWASYFPLAWGWVGWVALVPLLVLVRTPVTGWRVYLGAWAAGLGFFWPVLQWMRVADERMYYTWGALATYCSLYFPLAVFLLRRLDRATPLPLTLTVPLVWTLVEYVRGEFMGGFATLLLGNWQHDYPGGFSWYFLGCTQQAFLSVIQIADLGGTYAVSFLVGAVNGLVFEVLAGQPWFRSLLLLSTSDEPRRRIGVRPQVVAVLVLLGAALCYGAWRLGQEDFETGPRVALLQGNLDQRIRNTAGSTDAEGGDARRTVARHYGQLCFEAADRSPRPDLIVWPETSFPDEWSVLLPGVTRDEVNPVLLKNLVDGPRDDGRYVAEHAHTNVLIGTTVQGYDLEPGDARWKLLRPAGRYNSALFLDAHGNEGPRYDKIFRIPFGEFVPLREAVPWLNRFAPYDFDYSVRPGEEFTRFPLGKYQFGVLICYEDSVADLARQYVRPDRGRPADFIVNISNDGWFDGTSEHEEHLVTCRFRAIECRRSFARAVNMGISAIIDGNGRVRALPGPTWAESKKIAAVVAENIPIDRRSSLYARWGDWLPWTCAFGVAAGLTLSCKRRRGE